MNQRKGIALSMSLFVMISISLFACNNSEHTSGEPWTDQQLMEPSVLAALLNDTNSELPVIFSVGPAAMLIHSIDIGSTDNNSNLEKLKEQLSKLSKEQDIVIYCGCCPFKNCPNIRPAFTLLNEMGFTNHKLLNLKDNLKTNWIDLGYPIQEK